MQTLLRNRRAQVSSSGAVNASLLAKKILCGNCGTVFRRKTDNGKVYWTCRKHDRQKDCCPIPQIPEAQITEAVLRLCHKLRKHHRQILSPLLEQLSDHRETELRSNRKIHDIDKEIAQLTEQNLVLVRLRSKGYVDSALYLSQVGEIDFKLRELRGQRRRILEASGEDGQIKATEAMLDYLEDGPEFLEAITEDIFETLVDKIIVVSAEQLKIRLHNGLELPETIERTVR